MFLRCIKTLIAAVSLQLCPGFVNPAEAQPPPAYGSITGRILDSTTSLPVEGAIAFITLTGIGASPGADGRFTLSRVPSGEHVLIVSRVGYHRAVIRVQVEGGGTLNLDVRLAAHPVIAGEAEVIADAPGLPSPPPLYFPDGGEKSWCAYGSETEVPVGILYTEKLLLIYHLDTVREDDGSFIRFWMLVYNGSDDTVEFDAQDNVSLDVTIGSRRYTEVKPVRSSGREADLAESASPRRNIRVERTLYVMAAQSQIFLEAAKRFDRLGGGAWIARFSPEPPDHAHGIHPRHLREVYDRCVHTGRLDRYRIAPDAGVDGTIRYPMPGFAPGPAGRSRDSGDRARFEFTVMTPTSEERIVFSMH